MKRDDSIDTPRPNKFALCSITYSRLSNLLPTTVVFLICASYTRWSSSRLAEKDGVIEDTPTAAHDVDALLLYAMELKFYLMFLLSALDLFGE